MTHIADDFTIEMESLYKYVEIVKQPENKELLGDRYPLMKAVVDHALALFFEE